MLSYKSAEGARYSLQTNDYFYCTDEEFKGERKMFDCLLKGKRR